MASDITSTTSFLTSNMKPANSEVIPALWGQNVCDNAAFLRGQRTQILHGDGVGTFGTTNTGAADPFETDKACFFQSFYVKDAHNKLEGTYQTDLIGTNQNGGNPVSAGTIIIDIEGDTGTYTRGDIFTDIINTDDPVFGTLSKFNITLSTYATDESWVRVRIRALGTMHTITGGGVGVERWDSSVSDVRFSTFWS